MNALSPSLPLPAMTREEFLDWDGHNHGKWEFDGVQPIPMTRGTCSRSRIMVRLIHSLLKRLDGTEWDVLAEFGLATVGDKVSYPDVQVTRTRSAGTAKLATDTVVAFEIVSPGSERTDRVDKVGEYAAVPSLRRHVILEQAAPVLTVLHRADAGAGWAVLPLAGGEVVEFPELGIAVPVDELYVGLTFPGDDAPIV